MKIQDQKTALPEQQTGRVLPAFNLPWPNIRFAAYLLITGCLLGALNPLSRHMDYASLFAEFGLVESLSCLSMLSGSVILAFLAGRNTGLRGIYSLMTVLCLLAAIRECNNHPVYEFLFKGKFSLWMLGGLLLAVVVFFNFKSILKQTIRLLHRPSAAPLIAGAAMVVIWAQFFVQKELFSPGQMDRIVEESLEMAGYFLIFCGIFEEWLYTRSEEYLDR